MMKFLLSIMGISAIVVPAVLLLVLTNRTAPTAPAGGARPIDTQNIEKTVKRVVPSPTPLPTPVVASPSASPQESPGI